MIPASEDIYSGEGVAKVKEALARFSLVPAVTEADFREGHAVLAAEFGPTGEIERPETLLAWFRAGSLSPAAAPIPAFYHLLLARDPDGALAGARDCFVTIAPAARRAVVLLSHSLVLPPYRRSGLAALLRTAPVALARTALARAGVAGGEVLLVAEMELIDPAVRISVIRLLAYGKAGFGVLPAQALPYAQPDFRDLDALGVAPAPLPFVALVRHVGHEHAPALSPERVRAVVDHLQAVHRCHTRAEHLTPIRDHALAGYAAFGGGPVPLIRPHRSDIPALYPLLQSDVVPLYPAAWCTAYHPHPPDQERAALCAAWPPPPEGTP